MQYRFTILFFFLGLLSAGAQSNGNGYPTDFRAPLDLPPSSAGSFGELRGNHFHSGLDFRTNRREGYPIYAVSDGYISRLRVQVGGFGNAVYITHPNGYTSVYAHLQRFNDRIGFLVNDYQYRKQAFDVDFPLLPIEVPVRKGEVIGWSGNTGSSAGPHLHFEFRDTKTEEIINPRLFGYEIPDRIKPTISSIYLYNLDGKPFSEKTTKRALAVKGAQGVYQLNHNNILEIPADAGFGIITSDLNSASPNRNGVYSIELKLDEQTIYLAEWERFFFQHSRGINSHVDYPGLLRTGTRIQKSFIEPGNPLTIYKKQINNGVIRITDQDVHEVEYVVKDASGNTSKLAFRVRVNPALSGKSEAAQGNTYFKHTTSNEFSTADVKVTIPEKNLYDDLDFRYSVTPKIKGGYSPVHHIHTRLIPVHDSYNLWIKPDSSLAENLYPKALIVNQNRISQGGTYEDGYVKTTVRAFGNFHVAVDTVPPNIHPVNIAPEKSMKGIKNMVFKISDNLSGIRTFEGMLNGQWILMQFDLKTRTLWHTFDERTRSGKNDFQLVVTDMKLNKRIYNVSFLR
ncbi:MAG TPA: M23 family metallopeptidase [Sphingobacteriaceae bacterium]